MVLSSILIKVKGGGILHFIGGIYDKTHYFKKTGI